MPAKKYNRYPISESYMVISQEKDRAAVYNNKGELQRCDTESLLVSPKFRQNGTLARSILPIF